MIDNIKQLWNTMKDETKKQVEEALLDEFNLKKDGNYLRPRWFYKGLIPESKQERTLEIMVNAKRLEIERESKIAEELGI